MYSCSKPIEKKLAGTWKVIDVQFQTDLQIDQRFLDESRESQKSISYDLLEDYTAKIHAGFSTFEGNWIYQESNKSVYMVFSGTFDTILVGRYEKDRLINEDSTDDFMITTVFGKEEE
jgi:hypothetical protein